MTIERTYLEIDGVIVPVDALAFRRSREFAASLESPELPFASLVEIRKCGDSETIVFDVEVERPQILSYDIRRIERLAVTFTDSDIVIPEVVSLRPDFPFVSHLNARTTEFPRSLCLYDRDWAEIRITWSAPAFIEWIRQWLADTARGELHKDDQGLEPLMFSCGCRLVLPADIDVDGDTPPLLAIERRGGSNGRVLIAHRIEDAEWAAAQNEFATLFVRTPPRCHGVIRWRPKTLADLCEIGSATDFDLLNELRARFAQLPDPKPLDAKLMLVVAFPKSRHDGGEVETIELKAFLTPNSIRDVGVDIGVWALESGTVSHLLKVDPTRNGSGVEIDVVNVSHHLTRDRAARFNGRERRDDRKIVAIGAGAIGSHVLLGCARAGYGQWTIVEDDELLPHNLSRHALGAMWVGCNKGEAVALEMNALTPDSASAKAINTNFLRSGDDERALAAAIETADVVLDMSASVPVAREISHAERKTRAATLFVAPSGKDLVIMVEDVNRECRLTDLEMAYYLAVACDDRLQGHLDLPRGRVRYGVSCRDVSSRISHAHIAAFGGVGADALQRALKRDDALACVWRMNSSTMEIETIPIAIHRMHSQTQGDWSVLVGENVGKMVKALRKSRLPDETGGILIGHVDHDRRVVYIIAALPSPPDSEEWPTMYVRGSDGLAEERERIQRCTMGNLDYIGEWHSHPKGARTLPSSDDRTVFEWIRQRLIVEGKPPVMLIAGDSGEIRVFVSVIGIPVPKAVVLQ